MNGALYPDDFPEEPVAGITDDEVEDFLAGIGKAGQPESERAELAGWLRLLAEDCDNAHATHITQRDVERFRRAADLLDGDR